MPIYFPPETEYAKERVKWEAQGTTMGDAGRPYVKREYPMMLHLAGAYPAGGVGILDTVIVESEQQRTARERNGWRATPLEALDAFSAQQLEFAKLSAEREYDKRHGMSPKARAEAEQHEDDAGARHLPTIPETPIRRRGRPVKVKAEATA